MTCPRNLNIEFGSVTIEGDATLGSKAVYRCDLGFEIVGEAVRVCELDGLVGEWSGEEPTCQGEEKIREREEREREEERLREKERCTLNLESNIFVQPFTLKFLVDVKPKLGSNATKQKVCLYRNGYSFVNQVLKMRGRGGERLRGMEKRVEGGN